MKAYLWISLWIVSLITCWYITKVNVKPEVVIQRQNVYIEKLKTEQQIMKIKEEDRFLVRIPFTQWGITKDFVLGSGTTVILMSL